MLIITRKIAVDNTLNYFSLYFNYNFVQFVHISILRLLILYSFLTIYIIPVFSVSFHLRLREVLVIFNDWQIVVRTVYYYSIVSYNYNRQLSVSEGLPYNLFRSVPANPPSLYIVTLPI